jgi:Mg/Co/Ni transporter MgtE
MEQTAIEWIESYLLKHNDISNNLRIREAFKQAKKMEKKTLFPKQIGCGIWLGIIIGITIGFSIALFLI